MKKLVFLLFIFLLPFTISTSNYNYAYAQSKVIEITFQNRSWKLNLDNYKVNSSIHTISYESYKFHRKSAPNKKVELINKMTTLGVPLKQAMNVIYHGINTDINKIITQINRPSVNASAKLNAESNFTYQKGVIGFKVEETKLYEDLLDAIQTGLKKVFVTAQNIQPEYSLSDIQKSTNKRSHFETSITSSTPERKHNIRPNHRCKK